MQSNERFEVLKKISEYEKAGLWDNPVEKDPETLTLAPEKIDYLGEKFSTRFYTRIANVAATFYFERLIRKGDLIIESIDGIENYKAVNGGAIITCNHFNPCDNYAVYRAVKPYLDKEHRLLYKVIREGNFTNFKGLYGFFFRHCNTLPLSGNIETMKKFISALSVLLARGEKILIYPEQHMWWNYRKPRPLKNGAFSFAVKNGVPVIPVFITMKDTDKKDKYGFFLQAYTIHFMAAIYPDSNLSYKENVENMKNRNYMLWKDIYERVYGTELKYGE